jgi:hypothetical protein
VAAIRSERFTRDLGAHWSIWPGALAGGLNLIFLIGFPLAFLGRLEGGVPEFIYGVPLAARLLLFILPITAALGVIAAIAAVANRRSSRSAAPGDFIVATALLSFVGFTWYWRLFST